MLYVCIVNDRKTDFHFRYREEWEHIIAIESEFLVSSAFFPFPLCCCHCCSLLSASHCVCTCGTGKSNIYIVKKANERKRIAKQTKCLCVCVFVFFSRIIAIYFAEYKFSCVRLILRSFYFFVFSFVGWHKWNWSEQKRNIVRVSERETEKAEGRRKQSNVLPAANTENVAKKLWARSLLNAKNCFNKYTNMLTELKSYILTE